MRALSIIEPWLQLLISGKKTVEFRTWTAPSIVGHDLLLCSSKGWDKDCAEVVQDLYLRRDEVEDARKWRGHARCIVRVRGIVRAREEIHGEQLGFSYHDDGKPTFGWEFEDVRPIEPFPVRGQLGIYAVSMPGQRTQISGLCTVVNLRRDEYDVYIGRAGRGQDGYFGNPYRVGIDGTGPEVLGKFKRLFLDKIEGNPEFKRRVLELKGKRLGCFCKPNPCHGDIIAAWVNSQTEE